MTPILIGSAIAVLAVLGCMVWTMYARRVLNSQVMQLNQVRQSEGMLRHQVGQLTALCDGIKGAGRLTLNEFSAACAPYRWKASPEQETIAASLGLMRNTGELSDQIRRTMRDGQPFNPQEAARTLGEVLKDAAHMANLIGLPLEDIAKIQLETLRGTDDPEKTTTTAKGKR